MLTITLAFNLVNFCAYYCVQKFNSDSDFGDCNCNVVLYCLLLINFGFMSYLILCHAVTFVLILCFEFISSQPIAMVWLYLYIVYFNYLDFGLVYCTRTCIVFLPVLPLVCYVLYMYLTLNNTILIGDWILILWIPFHIRKNIEW